MIKIKHVHGSCKVSCAHVYLFIFMFLAIFFCLLLRIFLFLTLDWLVIFANKLLQGSNLSTFNPFFSLCVCALRFDKNKGHRHYTTATTSKQAWCIFCAPFNFKVLCRKQYGSDVNGWVARINIFLKVRASKHRYTHTFDINMWFCSVVAA